MNKVIPLFCILILTGCATILSTNFRNVGINSHPQKANIYITNNNNQVVFEGQTPIILPLKSSISPFTSAEYLIKFSKDSFQQQSFVLKAEFNWLCLLFPPTMIIDGFTGNMFRIKNVYILENLKPEAPVIKYDDLIKSLPSSTK